MGLELNSTTAFVEKNLSALAGLISYTADKDRRIDIRVDLGAASGLLTSTYSSYKLQAIITRIGGSTIAAYTDIIIKSTGKTALIYNFNKSIYLQEDEVVTVWAKSFNALDISVSGNVYYTPAN